MSDHVADRLKNIEDLVLSLKEDYRAGQQRGPDSLRSTLSTLVDEHVADIKHHLSSILDTIDQAVLSNAASNNQHPSVDFELQISLISSQIENGFRNLAQNISSVVRNPNHDSTQLEFEEQVELLKTNNAEFLSAVTRLTAYTDAQNLLEAENIEREVQLLSQRNEIERLKVALDLAQPQQNPEGLGGHESHEDAEDDEGAEGVSSENAEYWKSREVELIAQHNEDIRLFTAKYRALFEEYAIAKGNIRVVCRIRQETAPPEDMIKLENPDQNFLFWSTLRAGYLNDSKKIEARDFEFQRVFGGSETNSDVFQEVKDFAQSAALGRTCTVMAYGATGTGKSYTFLAAEDSLIQNYIKLLFQLAQDERALYKYDLQVSAVEIYLNKIYDLLQPPVDGQKIEVRVDAESTTQLNSREEAMAILKAIVDRREVASTQQNATSSRSHFILTIKVSKRSLANATEKPIVGQVRFLDLAGSERVGRNSLSGASGPQQLLVTAQGNDINKGLLDLGKGIRSLATRGNFFPSHNLTRYIRSSLTPGSRLLVVATVSSLIDNQNSTLNTLRWSQDATGRASQGKLVAQGKTPESAPPHNSKPPAAGGDSRLRGSSISSAVSTPTKMSAPPNQGNTKR